MARQVAERLTKLEEQAGRAGLTELDGFLGQMLDAVVYVFEQHIADRAVTGRIQQAIVERFGPGPRLTQRERLRVGLSYAGDRRPMREGYAELVLEHTSAAVAEHIGDAALCERIRGDLAARLRAVTDRAEVGEEAA